MKFELPDEKTSMVQKHWQISEAFSQFILGVKQEV